MEENNEFKSLNCDTTSITCISSKQHVFIVGSKGIPAKYGGFETFVEKLTQYRKSDEIRYHVACLSDKFTQYEYNGAECVGIKVPSIGAAKAVYYDLAALHYFIKYCKKHSEIKAPIFYVLACRIGPFIGYYKKQIEKLGGKLFVNPDGHEWKRAKWSAPIRKYWKISEKYMVKHADLLICDSKSIEQYIREEYKMYTPSTTFIAYGSDIIPSTLTDNQQKVVTWYQEKEVKPYNYYLVVGRFVPENNYETMLREFMKSKTKKDFVLITNVSEKFIKSLKVATEFDRDSRIKFVGTVYDGELLKKIRENAYGYFHGHEVGGTNPSLLEALASTKLNLLLDVGFNREVGQEGALYWRKEEYSLARLIDEVDQLSAERIEELGNKARERIKQYYNWDYIVNRYEELFLK